MRETCDDLATRMLIHKTSDTLAIRRFNIEVLRSSPQNIDVGPYKACDTLAIKMLT